jgi:hypothetical protein
MSAETSGLIDELARRIGSLPTADLRRIEAFLSISNVPDVVLQAATYARRRAAAEEFKHELG